jgi:DNA polymerase III delta prime subunit
MSLVKRQYDDFVWELKYRPNQLDKIILPDSLLKMFNKVKSSGKLPNMMFSGPPGTGKTTTAFVLADTMGLSAYYMNMSLDTKIENIRGKFMDFVTSVSLEGRQKVLIGDEFDRLSPNAMDSLKGAIEKASKNCKFIFTSNHKGKIIEPIISRLQEVDFIFKKADAAAMKKKMWKAACQICEKEEVEYEKAAVAEIVKQLFPDMRKILNHLQMLGLRGEITKEAVTNMVTTDTEGYFKFLRDADWSETRAFIADLAIPWQDFYSVLYQNVERYIAPESISAAIILIAKYQFEGNYAADKSIPLAALSMELMDLEFKKDF